jgi:alkylated DNA repair dioxygenase AlkB
MYDRDVDVPRLVASYKLPGERLPAVLAEAAQRAAGATGTPFNSVGLNFYRNGRDSVSTRSSPAIRLLSFRWERRAS